MDATGREFWPYSTHTRCRNQLEEFWEVMHWRAISISWLYPLGRPFVSRWKLKEWLMDARSSLKNSFNNQEVN